MAMTASFAKDDWKFPGNFVDVGRVPTDALARLVRRIPEPRWTSQRPQTYLAEYLEPIVLVEDETVDTLVVELDLPPLLTPVLRILARRYGAGVPALVSLVRLRAHTMIPRHRDGPDVRPRVWSHRTHTAVLTNPDVVFRVQDETRHIAQGHIVEINNWREHDVTNAGENHRVHLIVDWTPFAPLRRVA